MVSGVIEFNTTNILSFIKNPYSKNDDFPESEYILVTLAFTFLFFKIYSRNRVITSFFRYEAIFDKLSSQQQEEWKQKIVSMVHALIVAPLSLKVYWDTKYIPYSEIGAYQSNMSLTHIILAIGGAYFIWDFYICILKFKHSGIANLLHAILGLSSIINVVVPNDRPMFQTFVALMFVTEISTIPLNLKFFQYHIDSVSKRNEQYSLIFAILFIVFRNIIIVPLVIVAAINLMLNPIEFYKTILLLFHAILIIGLNSYWGWLIVKKLYKHLIKTKLN
ncbi:hypothetical protein DLAC_01354 [Tieghemostelium lacteum]|uniref:TLC domain-containing protein n=1 Tax=Tieghemostelium lacteum TaxID=361077 RepID=A0A152A8G6_TIELA|nr:hypothetical protein DLAC_01354 [Tieghemostelium lacteum]|eukprot:KYR02508.1 hypothetical protein DLAC_01354 [Tieghemostelium lacteum]